MANENEDIKKDNPENKPHHHTWTGDLIEKIEEKIEETIDNIDADFPLSGGEEPHHAHPHHKTEKTEEEIAAEKEHEQHKKHSFLSGLNSEFPLSGGE